MESVTAQSINIVGTGDGVPFATLHGGGPHMKRQTWTAMALAISAGCIVGAQQPTDSPQTQSGGRIGNGSESTVTVMGCVQDGGSAPVAKTSGAAGSTAGGSAPAPVRAGNYILANAAMGSSTGASGSAQSGAAAAGTTGSTGAGVNGSSTGAGAAGSPATGSANGSRQSGTASYLLEGRESDLKTHVGHRVEVTGMIVASNAPGAGASTTGGTASGGSAGRTGAGGNTTGNSTGAGNTGNTTGASGSTGAPGSVSSGATGSGSASSGMTPHLRVSSVRMISADCSGSGR
jgi:hypothetical protein